MNYSTLWHSMTLLPSLPAIETRRQVESTPADVDTHLPRWERHPRTGTGRETGNLDPEWIRRNLP